MTGLILTKCWVEGRNGMNRYARIRKIISEAVDRGITDFAIFPYGEIGMQAKQILNECFGITERAVIDNGLCRYNPKIVSLQDFIKSIEGSSSDSLYILYTSDGIALQSCLEQLYPADRILDLSARVNFPEATSSYGPLLENDNIESIGRFCSFAVGSAAVWNHQLDMVVNHSFIYSGQHMPVSSQKTLPKFRHEEFNKKFVIGNDVWLGRNVILTNGVKIGNGVRAAAGAVITKDVPDYAVVAGVPARIIKYRFTAEQIRMLNEIAWWDWPVEKIQACYDDFIDIDLFLQKHYPPR